MRFMILWSILALLLFTTASASRADTISIQFGQLDGYAGRMSPGARILEQEYRLTVTDRDSDLLWSNPEAAYDREVVESNYEYSISLGKQFEMPWVYFARRGSWDTRVEAAELSKEDGTARLLSELRSGYVRIKLLREQRARLGLLRDIITDASKAAVSRHREGHISSVDEHLIQMFLISLIAQYQGLVEESRMAENRWKAQMGIDQHLVLELPTDVSYQKVLLPDIGELTAAVPGRPGYRSRIALGEWLRQRAKLERRNIFPGLGVYAGFKRVEPELDGYVFGLSLELPIFGANRAAAKRYELESGIEAIETDLYLRELNGRIETLVLSVHELHEALGLTAGHIDGCEETMKALLASYNEGWIDLNEFLSSVEIEMSGIEDYHDQLIKYYTGIFELEAITGRELVSFDKQE